MLGPRNTLVEVEILPDQKEKKIGNIVIPDNRDLYAEGIVRNFGPGNPAMLSSVTSGYHSETTDLRVGQRVLVKRYDVRPMGQGLVKNEAGIKFIRDGKTFLLFEQMSIVYILEEAGPLNFS